jgi:hypothetical protein
VVNGIDFSTIENQYTSPQYAPATPNSGKVLAVNHNGTGTAWVTQIATASLAATASVALSAPRELATLLDSNPHGAHLYWRVNVSANNGSPNTSIEELEFLATPSGSDQANGGTALASSEFSNHNAFRAFDNSTAGNPWASVSTPAWLGYQFVAPVWVSTITIQARDDSAAEQSPRDFTIQFSDDGTNWFTAWSVTNQTGWALAQIRRFTDPAYTPTSLVTGDIAMFDATVNKWQSSPALRQLLSTTGSVTSASYAATASMLLGSVQSASYAATASAVLLPPDVPRTVGAFTAITNTFPGSSSITTAPLYATGSSGPYSIDATDPQSTYFNTSKADYYSLTVAANGYLFVSSSATAGTPYLVIYSANGSNLTQGGHVTQRAVSGLAQGQYFIEVYQGNSGQTTNYSLFVSGNVTNDSINLAGTPNLPMLSLTNRIGALESSSFSSASYAATASLATSLVLTSPNGTRYVLTVANDGVLSTTLY